MVLILFFLLQVPKKTYFSEIVRLETLSQSKFENKCFNFFKEKELFSTAFFEIVFAVCKKNLWKFFLRCKIPQKHCPFFMQKTLTVLPILWFFVPLTKHSTLFISFQWFFFAKSLLNQVYLFPRKKMWAFFITVTFLFEKTFSFERKKKKLAKNCLPFFLKLLCCNDMFLKKNEIPLPNRIGFKGQAKADQPLKMFIKIWIFLTELVQNSSTCSADKFLQ